MEAFTTYVAPIAEKVAMCLAICLIKAIVGRVIARYWRTADPLVASRKDGLTTKFNEKRAALMMGDPEKRKIAHWAMLRSGGVSLVDIASTMGAPRMQVDEEFARMGLEWIHEGHDYGHVREVLGFSLAAYGDVLVQKFRQIPVGDGSSVRYRVLMEGLVHAVCAEFIRGPVSAEDRPRLINILAAALNLLAHPVC
jgi:hypothetical protein